MSTISGHDDAQSYANPSPGGNSLLTGNFKNFGLFGENFSLRHQRVEGEFPKIQNRELFRANRERRAGKTSEQGMRRAQFYAVESA
jgi:hypothetical protein